MTTNEIIHSNEMILEKLKKLINNNIINDYNIINDKSKIIFYNNEQILKTLNEIFESEDSPSNEKLQPNENSKSSQNSKSNNNKIDYVKIYF